ncbi:MAG: c-type cytochrome biogenesis protein CcmI [Rhodobacteraceae bacterium]|nr:c-type cytochrome biogenesis protein CcmI [Paracoccaceae bacterium]
MEIWLPGIILSAIASGIIVLILFKQRLGKAEGNLELQVYARQLDELEQMHREELIPSSELSQAKSELGRKILNSDKQFQNTEIADLRQFDRRTFFLSAIIFFSLIVGSQLIHNFLGNPGYVDQPINKRIEVSHTLKDNRLSQSDYIKTLGKFEDEAREFIYTIERLNQAKSQNEKDYQDLFRIFIQASLAEEKIHLASLLYNQLILYMGEGVSLDDLVTQVELMIYSSQLYVSPEAELVILAILERDPTNVNARFYLGLMYEQVARPDLTFEIWNDILVANDDVDSPLIDYIKSHIGEVAQRAGINLF